MTDRRRTLWRIAVAFLASALVLFAHATQQRLAFESHLQELQERVLTDYLREAFPTGWFGDPPRTAPDTASIRQRIHEFNDRHWLSDPDVPQELRLAVVRAGPVTVEFSIEESRVREFHAPIGMGGRMAEFSLIAERPSPVTFAGALFATLTFALGLLLARIVPHPSPVNEFPLARDMALVLDRKVSADQPWGAYRLTHLGGGGQLPGIARNDFSACNDTELRQACLGAIRDTFETLQPRLLSAAPDDIREAFEVAIKAGFDEGDRRLRDEAPTIWSDLDVNESFRPFIRDQVLGFSLISFANPANLVRLIGLDHDRIEVGRPPAWLIGGYELYYPQQLFVRLVEEIRSGMQSGFGRSFDRIRVSADPTSAFITVDFIAADVSLSKADCDRIRQYLARPFAGGLDRIVNLMQGFGRFSILDGSRGFDLTQRKAREGCGLAGLVNRCEFRRIRPEELSTVRSLMHP